ncbi:hypothetical protein HS088_TW15G00940 [Tripterygium wilfordii]|uniref:Uncharacterized protein n=1 Tax=Tripterygium wilfordii TaxID=458696 RepID=A0A7J7CMY8_TRIWF|nr:hypothetical protein HS088_TW15G00940 [Tripterygium wilfordii]
MHGIVDRENENGGPYVRLVMAYPTEEIALEVSGFFSRNSDISWVDVAGKCRSSSLEKGNQQNKIWSLQFQEIGENLLAKIEFTLQQLYSTGKQMKEAIWLPICSKWFHIASELQTSLSNGVPRSVFCGVSDLAGTPNH